MRSATSLLAGLQLSDSALPIGRFVHSYGLEAWLHQHDEVSPAALADLVEAYVCLGIAPLDGAVLAHAHRATELGVLLQLDALLTARKLTLASRASSQNCGRQLASLATHLA